MRTMRQQWHAYHIRIRMNKMKQNIILYILSMWIRHRHQFSTIEISMTNLERKIRSIPIRTQNVWVGLVFKILRFFINPPREKYNSDHFYPTVVEARSELSELAKKTEG